MLNQILKYADIANNGPRGGSLLTTREVIICYFLKSLRKWAVYGK